MYVSHGSARRRTTNEERLTMFRQPRSRALVSSSTSVPRNASSVSNGEAAPLAYTVSPRCTIPRKDVAVIFRAIGFFPTFGEARAYVGVTAPNVKNRTLSRAGRLSLPSTVGRGGCGIFRTSVKDWCAAEVECACVFRCRSSLRITHCRPLVGRRHIPESS